MGAAGWRGVPVSPVEHDELATLCQRLTAAIADLRAERDALRAGLEGLLPPQPEWRNGTMDHMPGVAAARAALARAKGAPKLQPDVLAAFKAAVAIGDKF